MAVMRSIFYVPGNNPKFIEKAPTIPADIITLDLEDAVPPSEKENARKMIVENMHKIAKESVSGAEIYVRINNWETEMTNDDLEAVVQPGLNGVTLAKTGHPDDVKRLAWKLEELERRCGFRAACPEPVQPGPSDARVHCGISGSATRIASKERTYVPNQKSA